MYSHKFFPVFHINFAETQFIAILRLTFIKFLLCLIIQSVVRKDLREMLQSRFRCIWIMNNSAKHIE